MVSPRRAAPAAPATAHREALRVVLLEVDATAPTGLDRWLATGRGIVVRPIADRAGVETAIAGGGVDAVVIAAPPGDVDAIAAAAARVDRGRGPVLIALGAAGERSCDAVLPRSIAPAAVRVVLYELLHERARAVVPAPTLPELLVAFRSLGETGVLELRAHDVCTRIILRDGAPVFAEGGALRETLGRLLLRRGALSETDYVRVIERMTERLIENEATRMGEVLVELGMLTPPQVFEALAVQVREKILGCFRWQRFEYHFEPRGALPADVLAYQCPPVEALLLAGLREHFAAARLEPLLAPACGAHVRLRSSPEQVAALFQATPAEQRLLHDLDGTRPIETLRSESPLGALHAGQLLAALVVADALELGPRGAVPAHARTAPTAAPLPERSQTAARASASLSQLRRTLARAGAAPPPATQAPVDARSAALESERAFRQGLALLAQPALPGAQRAFARACELKGDEPEYALLASWVEMLVAKDEASRALARESASASARRVLRNDPDSARAHSILGQIAIAAGELDTAERHFHRALRTAPDDRDALRGMRTLQRRRSQPASSRPR